MKSKQILGVAASLAALSLSALSCSQDENQMLATTPEGGNAITVNASFEGQKPGTRTSLDDVNYNVLWSANDAFTLFYSDGQKENSPFTLTAGEGTTSGQFTGTPASGKVPAYAVFPASQATSVSGNTLTMTLPEEITNYTGLSNGPMLGKGFYDEANSQWGNIQFNHLAAMLKLTVNKFPEEAKALEITASKEITGTFTADLSKAEPVLAYSGTDGTTSVKATFTSVTGTNVSKSFYFPIPTGEYTFISAKLTNGADKTFFEKTLTNTITLKRRDILVVPPFDYIEATGSTPQAVSSAISNANLPASAPKVEQTTTVSIPHAVEVSTSNKAIEVPVVENSNIALTFGAVPTGTTSEQPLEINETVGTQSNDENNNVSIAIPQVSIPAEAPNITLNLAKSTVTLEATSGTATYGTVTATTADNTLIVKEGVTVKELIIAKGNVVVYGTVKSIKRSEGNPDAETSVKSYGKADIQSATDLSNLKFESTWDGASKVAVPASGQIFTAAQLASLQPAQGNNSATASGLTATVTKDIMLQTDVNLNNHPWLGMVIADKTFDGQGKVISNLTMNQYVLNEQNTANFIPQACIGFFAAAYTNAVIKNVALVNVTINPKVAVKWVGALVGYSTTTQTYDNCSVKQLSIVDTGSNAIRIGGLIGFIGSGNPTLTGCKVADASLTAKSSIGGLVGTIQCSGTFTNCTTENITICTKYASGTGRATVSRFIGNPQNGSDMTITISGCTSAPFTPEERVALDFNQVVKIKDAKSYYYDDGNQWVGISDGITLVVGGTTLTDGTDYNVYKEVGSDSTSTPDYSEDHKDWD